MPVGRFILLSIVVGLFWAVDVVTPANQEGLRAATYALVLASSAAIGLFRGDDELSQLFLLMVNAIAVGSAFMAAWNWMLVEGGIISFHHAIVVSISLALCGGCIAVTLFFAFLKLGGRGRT